MTKETWTARHDEAALLVAEDKLTDQKIAEKLDISKRTLEDWKKDPYFQERLDEVIAEIRAALMKRGIARLDRRVARLNQTWLDLQTVIEERACEMDDACAGGHTGLVVLQKKGLGKGDDFQIIDEYVVDTGILAELRALEMQAAKELGQWTEKRDVTSGGKPVAAGPDLRGLSSERLKLLEDILMEAEETVGDGNTADSAPGEGGAV